MPWYCWLWWEADTPYYRYTLGSAVHAPLHITVFMSHDAEDWRDKYSKRLYVGADVCFAARTVCIMTKCIRTGTTQIRGVYQYRRREAIFVYSILSMNFHMSTFLNQSRSAGQIQFPLFFGGTTVEVCWNSIIRNVLSQASHFRQQLKIESLISIDEQKHWP